MSKKNKDIYVEKNKDIFAPKKTFLTPKEILSTNNLSYPPIKHRKTTAKFIR